MMNKLLMLSTGAFALLALAAIPTVAVAGEFTAHCESGASCSGTITGGVATLNNTSNEKIECSSADGTATQTSGSSTGTVELTFTGCKEKVSGFNFACNSAGAASGVITTNAIVSHLIYIEHNAGTPGVLLTGFNVTFACAAFFKKTVTGNIIGHWTNPQCGAYVAEHTVTFDAGATPGTQRYPQVTTTGTSFDLISEAHNGGIYKTTSLTGSLTFKAENGNREKFTC